MSFFGKADDPLAKFVNNLDDVQDSANWIKGKVLSQPIQNSSSFNFYSRMDSSNIYGIGINQPFPKSAYGYNLEIVINARTRCNVPGSELAYALSIKSGDSTIIWDSKDVEFRSTNQWHYFEKRFKVPANFVTDKNSLLLYPWIKNRNASVDIDELVIRIYPTYIDSSRFHSFSTPINNFNKTVYGEKYNVLLDTFHVNVSILSVDGDTIVSSIGAVLDEVRSYYGPGRFNKLKITELGYIKKVELSADPIAPMGVSLNGKEAIGTLPKDYMKLEIIVNNLTGEIRFNWELKPFDNWSISRAGLVIYYSINFESAIKMNGVISSNNKVSSFWLNDGQVLLKGAKRSYLTKSNSNVSSLQLFNLSDYLIVNFTSSQDHPMLHYPLLPKNENRSEDISSVLFRKDSIITGSFSLIPVRHEQPLLRVLNNPNGFLSSMVWTEHADFSDIRTQRAVMLGNENIRNSDSAIGGFVRYGIPITKSVFYDNPTKEKNSLKDKRFQSASISIKRSPEFLDLLHQLYGKGFEICLHTPDPFSTKRKRAEEAMEFMKKNFKSVNWIDHGYDNSIKSNREDINCDGLDSASKFYMGDLFKKYGVKYAWSSYYEDKPVYANTTYNSFFTTPYSGWADPFSTPEYFRNAKEQSLISWRTTFTLDPADGRLWDYYFSDTRLNDLVQSKGNCILHCYLARVDSTNGFYSFNGDNIVINSEFDKVLAKLKKYQDENKIWLTTVEKLLDYRLQIENVEIEYLDNDRVAVINKNESVIKGVSVISTSSHISAGEKNIRLKKDGEETIAIFDLAPKEKLILDLR